MSSHTFSFPPEASGLSYVIRDEAGTNVGSGTLGSSDDVVILAVDLPWGDSYVATAGAFRAQGEAQEVAGGGGGLSKPCWFAATIAPFAIDTGGQVTHDLTMTSLGDSTVEDETIAVIDAGLIKIVKAGLYEITSLTTPKITLPAAPFDRFRASIRSLLNVNGGSGSPAYYPYPGLAEAFTDDDEATTLWLSSIPGSITQELAVDDTVGLAWQVHPWSTVAAGALGSVDDTNTYVALTRLGDIPA